MNRIRAGGRIKGVEPAIWRVLALWGRTTERSIPTLMGHPETFEAWKTLLRSDCLARGKVQAFDGIGDVILRILYENGVDPTVEAVVRDGLLGTRR